MKYTLLHGSGNGPDMWLPWLKKELENRGNEVWMPHMPVSEKPDIQKQLPFLLESSEITPGSILIGHSAACPVILGLLQTIDFKIRKAVLVAGYYHKTDDDISKSWPSIYEFKKIKSHCKDFLFIVSDNDPWGCNDAHSRPYFDKLGGTMVIVKDGGHFGSNTFNNPMYEFPLLLNLL